MRLVGLFWRLLRYRVAIMLILFMLLAVAIHGQASQHPWRLLFGAVALAFGYVSATSSNDLADEAIDKLNHPDSPGRPLINGWANRRDMWVIFAAASVAALVLAATISVNAALIMAASILINILYSLPPARFSYRTYLAPFVLGLGYVGVPYVLGLAIMKVRPGSNDILWLLGLYCMFVGRIILKDFRDRKGDAAYGKPTFLLRYGKNMTCLFSLIGLSLGIGILVFQVRHTLWLATTIAVFLVSILAMLRRLQKAPEGKEEQLSIGVGAKMGNGMLLVLLTVYLLQEEHATTPQQISITLLVALLFFTNYFAFIRNPERAAIGYKG